MTIVSAIVVLNPPGGRLRGDEIITAEDHERFLPAPEEVAAVMDWFSAAGFAPEAPGPNSFSISADGELFDAWFGSPDGPFDTSALPEPIASAVAAVEVPGPPDFGPGAP